jgi:hypothetical protein
MHDQEKSDSAIVAVKSPNKTGFPVAEAMERRAGTKGSGSTKHAPDADPGSRDPGAWAAYGKPISASPSNTQGSSRMLESGSSVLCGGVQQ